MAAVRRAIAHDTTSAYSNHYLHNLVTMTSSEATRLWRKAIKKLSTVHVFIAENLMNYMNLLLITFVLALLAETITSNIVPACTCCNQSKGSEVAGWMRTEFGVNRLSIL